MTASNQTLAKIDLPARAAVKINFSAAASSQPLKSTLQWNSKGFPGSTKTISTVSQVINSLQKPPVQAFDLYIMKVISLLAESKWLHDTQAREVVRNTSCETSIDKDNQILTISQVLEPIPGQIIKVVGAFMRDVRTSLFTNFVECKISN